MSTPLDDVYKVLTGIDDEVHYGLYAGMRKDAPWNYIVYSRDNRRPSRNLTGLNYGIMVSIVRENYVPDALIETVINEVSTLPGFRLDEGQNIEFVYDVRPGTDRVVEMVILHFVKGIKR